MSRHTGPAFIRCVAADGECIIEAASPCEDGEKKPKLPTMKMIAYTGGKMSPDGWGGGVVVDLAGMSVTAKSRPILFQHDPAKVLGHTESIDVGDRKIKVSAVMSGTGDAAQEVAANAANGFPYQASIGLAIEKMAFVPEGETAEANGQKFKGPVYMARRSRLMEISAVSLGADDDTSTSVAAAGAEGGQIMAEELKVAAAAPAVAPPVAPETDMLAKVLAALGESEKRTEAKITDAVNSVKLEAVRASRPVAPAISEGRWKDAATRADILTCALAMGCANADTMRGFRPEVIEASRERFRRGIGVGELLLEAARANGYDGRMSLSQGNLRDVLRAAFTTADISTILSSASNKFLLEGYNSADLTFFQIAKKVNVKDFKSTPCVRMTSDARYIKLGNDGQIEHGKIGEDTYNAKADTFARMFGITRQDLINDDAQALADRSRQVGAGAPRAVAHEGFTLLLANTGNWFHSGHSNYNSGAGSALGTAGLNAAKTALEKVTDPQGNPAGLQLWGVLAPTDLWATLRGLVISPLLVGSTAQPNVNVFGDLGLKMFTSPYLSNASYTGHSAAHWYALCNPMFDSAFSLALLNGQETPTVETADADFDELGIAIRGYFDFGVAQANYRAWNKNIGS